MENEFFWFMRGREIFCPKAFFSSEIDFFLTLAGGGQRFFPFSYEEIQGKP